MPMEVECKILGMTVDEFLLLVEEAGMKVEVELSHQVRDEYWEMPSDCTVRYRIEDKEWVDLTIKGAEENDGNHTSEREELILRLSKWATPDKVGEFMRQLGGKSFRIVEKFRTLIWVDDTEDEWEDINIHHDEVEANGKKLEWVEIEASSRTRLQKFLFRICADKLRDRISNKTTLDLIEA